MERALKGGISIDADSGPLGYVLFDVVVEVEKHLLFSDWLWHIVNVCWSADNRY